MSEDLLHVKTVRMCATQPTRSVASVGKGARTREFHRSRNCLWPVGDQLGSAFSSESCRPRYAGLLWPEQVEENVTTREEKKTLMAIGMPFRSEIVAADAALALALGEKTEGPVLRLALAVAQRHHSKEKGEGGCMRPRVMRVVRQQPPPRILLCVGVGVILWFF